MFVSEAVPIKNVFVKIIRQNNVTLQLVDCNERPFSFSNCLQDHNFLTLDRSINGFKLILDSHSKNYSPFFIKIDTCNQDEVINSESEEIC